MLYFEGINVFDLLYFYYCFQQWARDCIFYGLGSLEESVLVRCWSTVCFILSCSDMSYR